MVPTPLGPSTAPSSVAEEIRRHVGSIDLAPADGLSHWLPDLKIPARWTIVATPPAPAAVTRMALCRLTPQQTDWNGCDVIALYQFAGSAPESVVHDGVDRTLRDLAAQNVQRRTVKLPLASGGLAVRSSGSFLLAGRPVWGQFTNYVVNTGTVSGLVEHSVLVGAPWRARLARDIRELTEGVYRSLVASIGGGYHSAGE